MAKFTAIAATMEATLRAEGCTKTSTAKPTADQIDEFAGRFKIAAAANGAVFTPPDNLNSWMAYCPAALALIVGRGSALDPWKQLEFAVAGASCDPKRQAEIIAKYRPRLSSAPTIDVAAIRTEMLKIAASVERVGAMTG
jgi:hypothetical protein